MQRQACRALLLALIWSCVSLSARAEPEQYVIDTKDVHAAILFRISHLGMSWLHGRFEKFDGSFTYDADNPADNKVSVTVDTRSIDTHHAKRDEHLRGADYLDAEKYPTATFISTAYEPKGGDKAELKGELTLHGVTRPVVIEIEHIGHGDDPWGGYRRGFEGRLKLKPADFGIDYDLGPAARTVELTLSIEGVRK